MPIKWRKGFFQKKKSLILRNLKKVENNKSPGRVERQYCIRGKELFRKEILPFRKVSEIFKPSKNEGGGELQWSIGCRKKGENFL